MTVQQEAVGMINSLPEESVRALVEFMRALNPSFQTQSETVNEDVSKRIGIGRGIITDPENFDKWDEEIASLFEESAV